jgi:hypothetical protein
MMTGAGDIGEIDDVADLEQANVAGVAAVDDDDTVEGDDIAPPVPEPDWISIPTIPIQRREHPT